MNIDLVRVLLQTLSKKGINKTSVEVGIRDLTLFFKNIIIEIQNLHVNTQFDIIFFSVIREMLFRGNRQVPFSYFCYSFL